MIRDQNFTVVVRTHRPYVCALRPQICTSHQPLVLLDIVSLHFHWNLTLVLKSTVETVCACTAPLWNFQQVWPYLIRAVNWIQFKISSVKCSISDSRSVPIARPILYVGSFGCSGFNIARVFHIARDSYSSLYRHVYAWCCVLVECNLRHLLYSRNEGKIFRSNHANAEQIIEAIYTSISNFTAFHFIMWFEEI